MHPLMFTTLVGPSGLRVSNCTDKRVVFSSRRSMIGFLAGKRFSSLANTTQDHKEEGENEHGTQVDRQMDIRE